MTAERPRPGQIVKSDELARIVGVPTSLDSEARRIIARAEFAAEQVQQIVQEERGKLDGYLRDISDVELKTFLDIETVKRKAEGFVAMMDASAALHRDFAAVAPWLTRIVGTSIRRILGTFDDEDLVSRLVAEALQAEDPAARLTIRAGSDAMVRLRRARQAHPDRFDGIAGIVLDTNAEAGEMSLECPDGLIDITLDAQIAAVLSILAAGAEPGRATP